MNELKKLKLYRLLLYIWGLLIVTMLFFGIGTWQGIVINLIMIAVVQTFIGSVIKAHMKALESYVYHYNTWWWGKSLTVITSDGYGSCELCICDDYPEWGIINALMVHVRKRCHGLGKKLVLECERKGHEVGLNQFFLEVNKRNEWLLGYYKELGYEVCPDSDQENKAVWKMSKTIES